VSAALVHLQAAAIDLAQAAQCIPRADAVSEQEWPAVASAMMSIRRELAAIDLRLEGKIT
jgi:hypothetical protein